MIPRLKILLSTLGNFSLLYDEAADKLSAYFPPSSTELNTSFQTISSH